MTNTAYPVPPTPRVHAWVSSSRSASGVVEIKRVCGRGARAHYDVVDPTTEEIIHAGTWSEVTKFATSQAGA